MEQDDDRPNRLQKLRGRAKRLVSGRGSPPDATRLSATELKQLHELQVHQVELEMQNEELRKVRAELHASLDRYTALYEDAPVALLTLGPDSTITESNQAATDLLRTERPRLLERRLGSFVTAGSLPAFNAYLDSMVRGDAPEYCEINLVRDDGSRLYVQATAVSRAATSAFPMVLVDVTARHELLQQNRLLTRRMFDLLENDRRSLAREIHDELGQWLTAIQSETGSMIRTESRLQPATRISIRAINANTAEMHNVLRRILLRLRPTLLDTVGLADSLREMVQHWGDRHKGVKCELILDGDLRDLGDTLNIAVFRIVQEALTNVARHAQAQHLTIRLERSPEGVLSLTITDDGKGFDSTHFPPGLGLLGMRERVIAMDGDFTLWSQPQQGVQIRICIPSPTKREKA